MEKAKKLIDAAFKQSLHLICERFGLSVNDMTLMVKFVGRKMVLTVFNKDKELRQINLQSIVGSKMVAIRMTANGIRGILRSVQFAFSTHEELSKADDVYLVLYDSPKARKPCMGVFIKDKPQKTLAISDVVDALEIGDEQLN
jgi:hypothetical protein